MAFNESLASISLAADASIAKYTGVPGQPGSAVPNSGFQYRFVKVTGKAQCGLATAAADRVVGVLQNKPQVNGQAATVGVWGVSLITAGGAIAAGDLLASDAEGRAVKAANAGEAKGVALSASANAGELVSILLQL
mgnify:CR=1 FL=1